MQKLFNKTIAVLVALIMTMISFAPATVYAAEEIQNSLTNQSNVEFDAKINDSYRVQADIDSELELKMNLKVSNTGYVKDAVVKIEGANYSIDEDSITNMSKTEEGYSLNDVNSGEELNASAKLKFKETDSKINIQDLNKESKISLDAIYVNKDGDEKKVHKDFYILSFLYVGRALSNLQWEFDNKENWNIERKKIFAFYKKISLDGGKATRGLLLQIRINNDFTFSLFLGKSEILHIVPIYYLLFCQL